MTGQRILLLSHSAAEHDEEMPDSRRHHDEGHPAASRSHVEHSGLGRKREIARLRRTSPVHLE